MQKKKSKTRTGAVWVDAMFDLDNEGQGHGEQQSQCCHSIANIQTP